MRKPSVLVIFLTVFIDLIGFGIVVPLVPLYGRHFNAHGTTIGIIIASFSAMQFVFAPIWSIKTVRKMTRTDGFLMGHATRGRIGLNDLADAFDGDTV